MVDLFLTKYIKSRVKIDDPAFDGTLRDYLNQAEKMNLISDVDRWLAMRELRNIQAHDYTNEAFESFVTAVQNEAAFALKPIPKLFPSFKS